MSDRFRIHKVHVSHPFPWCVDYPEGFTAPGGPLGEACSTFEIAVVTFVIRQAEQCPMCLRGAVVDTSWGWECQACGSSDVAVGCTRPAVGADRGDQ